MGHREQGYFVRAQWRGLFLWPFWFLQIALQLCLLGIFSYRLSDTTELLQDEERKAEVSTAKLIWEIANVAFSLVSLGLNMMEVAKFVAETLTPSAMFVSHIVKTLTACAVLGLDIVICLQNEEGEYKVIGLALDCGLLFATIVPAVYSVLVYRRHLKYDKYHHPVNVKPYGFNTPAVSVPTDDSRLELGDEAGSYSDGDTSYVSQTASMRGSKSGVSAISTRPLSLLSTKSARRVSTSSSVLSATSDVGAQLDVAKTRSGPREAYTHERSTEFDEYIRRRSMAEGSSPDALSPGSAAGGSRCVSWASSRGLMAVPEGQEEGPSYVAYNGVYSSFNSIRSSGHSYTSPVADTGSPGLGLGLSPLDYSDRRRRADSAASDRQGLLAESSDLGSQPMSGRM